MNRQLIKKWKVFGANGHRYLLRCNECGKEFELGGNNFNKGRGYFCSRHCRSINPIERLKNSRRGKVQFANGRIHPRGMLGKPAWNKGKENKYWKGDKNPNWNNGSSFGDYGKIFNVKFKRKIRSRDNFTCKLCNKTEKELKRKLDIHHIDYDKKNNTEKNLISLCHKCHMKTNPMKNRDYYKRYLEVLNCQ